MTRGDAEDGLGSPEPRPEGSGRNPREDGVGASSGHGKDGDLRAGGVAELMEAVVERENMMAAYERVEANKGAAGVDGMTVGRT